MSASNGPIPEQVAIACVVDSSLALSAEWNRLLPEYLMPLLARLHENYQPRLVRVFSDHVAPRC